VEGTLRLVDNEFQSQSHFKTGLSPPQWQTPTADRKHESGSFEPSIPLLEYVFLVFTGGVGWVSKPFGIDFCVNCNAVQVFGFAMLIYGYLAVF
jgi:hypothetical protein